MERFENGPKFFLFFYNFLKIEKEILKMEEIRSEFKEIQVSVLDLVGTITLYRPQRGNSITSRMGLEIISILKKWENVIFIFFIY